MSDLPRPRATLTRYNPPGLAALRYAGGRYSATLARMLASLPAQRAGDAAPLEALNRDSQGDWSIALVQAWAAVTEVLGFYQERIINEGYLRTAAEYRSVLELARAIGYELRPGVSASAHLAFTVLSTKDDPARQVVLPAGVAVLSVPPQGRLPQTFETDAAFTARAEWNDIRPELVHSGPVAEIARNATGLRLAGVAAGPRPGDLLLLLADAPPGAAALPEWLLAEVRAATPDPRRGQTVLSWAIVPGVGSAGASLRDARVYALRPPLGLFAYSRGGVYALERPGLAGAPAALGMPAMTVRALAREPGGALLAAADAGVFRSLDGGESWQSAGVGLARRSFHALALAEAGPIYSGGDGGAVFVSLDSGVSWTPVSGEVPPPPARGGVGPLPRTVVRALAAYGRAGQEWLAAGTDDGVLLSADRGRSWAPANHALPNADPKSGLAPVPVRALALARRGTSAELFAGTDAGVFHIAPPPSQAGRAALLAVPALLVLLAVQLFGPFWLLGRLFHLVAQLINTLIGVVNALALQLFQILGKELPEKPPVPLIEQASYSYAWLATQIARLPIVGPALKAAFTLKQLVFVTDALLLALALGLAIWLLARAWRAGARAPWVSLGRPVRALVAAADGRLFAGTEQGLFCSNDGDEQSGGYLDRAGRALTRALFGDLARSWRPVADPALAQANVSALAYTPAGELLAALAGGQVLRSADGGASWADLGRAPLKTPLALAPLDAALLAAGAPLDDPAEPGWPRAARHGGLLDLALPAPDLAAGDLVLLRQPDGPGPAPAPRLARVVSASLIDSRDPARPARLTRLAIEPPGDLGDFDHAGVRVLPLGPELSCSDERPVGFEPSGQIDCAGIVPGLAAGQLLAISGRRARATPPPGAALESPDGLRADPIAADDLLLVLAPPQPGQPAWRVRTRAGREGLLRCAPGALRLEPAHDDDEVVSELAELALAEHRDGRTILSFTRALANIYDRASVALCANIVPASHGATVKNELLGSSDAMSVNQRFLLKQPPLAYLATPAGAASTLTLTVNGVRWSEVPFLHNRARNQRVFVLRQDARSGEPNVPPDTAAGGPIAAQPPTFPSSEVIFGDGVNGAGLPTGTWKIEATYRSGGGSPGNLPAGSLTVLQSAPRGVKAVTNPLPSGGGADPERMSSARALAPQGLRAMERIVSLADFEDFARSYPGVLKAQMRQLARGRQRLLHLTIAGAELADGADDALPAALAGAIERQRAAPTPPLYIDHCDTNYFHVRARLLIEPAHAARADAIRAAARSALADAFGFASRALGQSLASSDIIRVLQALEGVAAVEIGALYLRGHAPTPGVGSQNPNAADVLLEARPTRLDGARILPAQLLLINASADDGIVLETSV
ncbi:baseplate J/gp47 family protein [Kouleothrix sp.]|uniref:baseplate J/gp47 family protein n=1 Tax=Kouleothrix sp. TaxID=2779161 RepID=UPI00391AAEE1